MLFKNMSLNTKAWEWCQSDLATPSTLNPEGVNRSLPVTTAYSKQCVQSCLSPLHTIKTGSEQLGALINELWSQWGQVCVIPASPQTISLSKLKALPTLLCLSQQVACCSLSMLGTTMQPHLACLQPILVQKQGQNSLLQLPRVDLFAVPAGFDWGSKDAGWLLHGEPGRQKWINYFLLTGYII